MATYTLTECMARLKRLPEKVAERGVEIMKEEITDTTDGPGEPVHLADTVKATKNADGTYTISTNKYVGGGGYGVREVGAIIRKGRPALEARYAKVLRWKDSSGWHSAKSVGPAKPNDFVKRTKERLEIEDWHL